MAKNKELINKMIQGILERNELLMRESEQILWRSRLQLSDIEEPSLEEPLKYALCACIIIEINNVWIKKGRSGIAMPKWIENAPVLAQPYSVIDNSYMSFWKDEESNETFASFNIFAPVDFLLFY